MSKIAGGSAAFSVSVVDHPSTTGGDATLTDSDGAELGVSTVLRGVTLTAANGVVLGSGDSLTGSGTVAGAVSVLSSGTVSPGLSTAILNTGSLSFASGSTFTAEVNGLTAGTLYDQLNTTGTVSLGGATLSLSGAVTATLGQMVTLIANNGTDSVSGTFAGLPEGASLTLNGQAFRIFYDGGTGNDVVLVRDFDTTPSTVYVDDTFATPIPGQDPDGLGPAHIYMVDAFPTIQGGVNAVADSGTVHVQAGTYTEQVTITKSLDLIGAGEGSTTILAPAIRTGTVAQGAIVHDYIVAAYAPASTIDVRIEGFTLDANGQNKTAGAAQLDGRSSAT